MSTTRRQRKYAQTADAHGADYSLRIVLEADRYKLPVSLGFAIVDQESTFRNVFGHDPTIFVGAGTVTKWKYSNYKHARGHTHMQGVGPCQLTWWEFQDRADHLGGCWVPEFNIRIAFHDLAGMIQKYGTVKGIGVYNAGLSGWENGAGHAYSREVRKLQSHWHNVLT